MRPEFRREDLGPSARSKYLKHDGNEANPKSSDSDSMRTMRLP